MNEDVRNGQDGWVLVEYEWSEDDGESLSTYERSVYGMTQHATVQRTQRLYWLPEHQRELAPSLDYRRN